MTIAATNASNGPLLPPSCDLAISAHCSSLVRLGKGATR